MSMPQFPTPDLDLTRDQALNMILSSIALEELALSHIINAEGEKIQYILANPASPGCLATTADILAVNKSVTTLLEMVMQNQLLLKNKMEKVLDCLPRPTPCPCPPGPPCPPEPPCPPAPPCPRQAPICFQVVPGAYPCDCLLSWQPGACQDHFGVCQGRSNQIQLPRTGWILVKLTLELPRGKAREHIVATQLRVDCPDKAPLQKLLYLTARRGETALSGQVILQMPCGCGGCFSTLLVRSPQGLSITGGCISFVRI